MKIKILWWLFVALVAGIGGLALLNRGWLQASPRMDCPATIELGEKGLGETVLKAFDLSNRGGKDLVVSDLVFNARVRAGTGKTEPKCTASTG